MRLTRAEIDAWKEQLRLEGQQCTGYTDGVLAALVYVILGVPGIKIADLAGFEGPDLWKLAVTAHRKHPHVIETLPDIPLSRGERFAVTQGLRRQRPELPVGEDLFAITDRTHPEHNNLMSKVLQVIAYSKRPSLDRDPSLTPKQRHHGLDRGPQTETTASHQNSGTSQFRHGQVSGTNLLVDAF